MTVTNYFPAKEDLVISAGASVVPDLAGVVRDRQAGELVLAALLRFRPGRTGCPGRVGPRCTTGLRSSPG